MFTTGPDIGPFCPGTGPFGLDIVVFVPVIEPFMDDIGPLAPVDMDPDMDGLGCPGTFMVDMEPLGPVAMDTFGSPGIAPDI